MKATLAAGDVILTMSPWTRIGPRTTYVPPKESFFLLQLDRLIAFANDEDDEHYLHPVIKAIVLHFWIVTSIRLRMEMAIWLERFLLVSP